MAHIELGVDESRHPGILGLLEYRPETARPLMELVEVLLRGPSTLSPGERELIAGYVSSLNDCTFCCESHSAFAAEQLPGGRDLVDRVRADPRTAATPKLRALLRVAAAVTSSGRDVTADLVNETRAQGATDREIHDTVLIAAAFCMFNRYVDGLGTAAPKAPEDYLPGARRIVAAGYLAR